MKFEDKLRKLFYASAETDNNGNVTLIEYRRDDIIIELSFPDLKLNIKGQLNMEDMVALSETITNIKEYIDNNKKEEKPKSKLEQLKEKLEEEFNEKITIGNEWSLYIDFKMIAYAEYEFGDIILVLGYTEFEKHFGYNKTVSVEEAFERISYCIKNETEIYYKEEEPFKVGETIYIINLEETDIKEMQIDEKFVEVANTRFKKKSSRDIVRCYEKLILLENSKIKLSKANIERLFDLRNSVLKERNECNKK